jgi:hypothetical protein
MENESFIFNHNDSTIQKKIIWHIQLFEELSLILDILYCSFNFSVIPDFITIVF